jgi:nudix-type nucleoside diphosphatase (YffH/AdpP family)
MGDHDDDHSRDPNEQERLHRDLVIRLRNCCIAKLRFACSRQGVHNQGHAVSAARWSRSRRRCRERVEIRKQSRLFDDFFKVDEIVVVHEQRDGTMSRDQRRLVFERGDAVAALLYEPDTHTVIMVDQFKVPTLIARRRDNPATTDGWITEAVAGMIDPGETAEEAIIRETLQETGYRISKPELICKFFSSPGGTSERIFLYFSEGSELDRVGEGGGVHGEDVRVVRRSAHDLFAQLEKRQIEDPKLAIGAYWLQGHISRMKAFGK